jgi:hypothetical protein
LVTVASDIVSFNNIRLIIILKKLVALRNINIKGIAEETVDLIHEMFFHSPKKSAVNASVEFGISPFTVHKML